jgi:hypothetical protein
VGSRHFADSSSLGIRIRGSIVEVHLEQEEPETRCGCQVAIMVLLLVSIANMTTRSSRWQHRKSAQPLAPEQHGELQVNHTIIPYRGQNHHAARFFFASVREGPRVMKKRFLLGEGVVPKIPYPAEAK